ncbi:MAG: nuclear transport factor 2 family protein [Balneolaceae bacterium]|nr:nuclear transport factor 2 family protein [Balneolaceae bacterium]
MSRSDKQGLIKVWNQAVRALEKGDWESYQRFWAHTDYIQLIHSSEREWLRGWKTIGTEYRKWLRGKPALRVQVKEIDATISQSKNTAWLTCKMHIATEGENGEEVEFESWQTHIFEKRAGEWKLVHAHSSNLY